MSWTPKYKIGQCFNLETPFPEYPVYPYKIIYIDEDDEEYVLHSINFPHDNTMTHLKTMRGRRFDQDRTPIECPTGKFRPRGGRKSRRNKNRHSRRMCKTHSRRRR